MSIQTGSALADSLTGTILSDTLDGGDGNDTLFGGDGSDFLDGGAGDDYVYDQSSGTDTLIGGVGDDRLDAFTGTGNKLLDGGEGNDFLHGGIGADSLFGGSGDDTLNGSDGNDALNAHDGIDSLFGGNGDDELSGGAGEDTLIAGAGLDTLLGGAGNDQLFSRTSDMAASFDDGANLMDGGDGDDSVYGGRGADTLRGEGGHDDLSGGDGADAVAGGMGNDTLDGGAGNDTLEGDDGADSLFGGNGDDELSGGAGEDTLIAGAGLDTLLGGAGNDQLFSRAADMAASFDDGANLMDGGDGDDSVYGGLGNDTLIGGAGNNLVSGAGGDDFYIVETITTLIVEGDGLDTADVAVSFAKIPSSIEIVAYRPGVHRLPYWIDALLPDAAAGMAFSQLLGTDLTYRFAFPSTLPSYDSNPEHALDYAPFSEVQSARAREALAYVSSVTSLKFLETADPAQPHTIIFANNRQSGSAGYANYPSTDLTGGDLFLNVDIPDNLTLADGTYAALTLIHEIGHAIGLEHPFSLTDGDGHTADPPHLSGAEDATAWTVMSYTSNAAQYTLRFGDLDIAALHYLYGPSEAARSGDDVYDASSHGPHFIWDGAGIDTLSVATALQPATVFLTPGYWGFVGVSAASRITESGQITINFGTVIEGLVGTSFADRLVGNSADNRIEGGDGDDTLEGGDGDDRLHGGNGHNQIFGEAGNDSLQGGPGDDRIDGGDGSDVAAFAGDRSSYLITRDAATSTYILFSDVDGADHVTAVERFKFANVSLDVTALIDGSAPSLRASDPANGAVGVSPSASIIVNFSEAIEPGIGTITLRAISGGVIENFDVARSTRVRFNGSTVTIDPTGDLSPNSAYSIEFSPHSVRDLSGNGMPALSVHDFDTSGHVDEGIAVMDLFVFSWRGHQLLENMSLSGLGTDATGLVTQLTSVNGTARFSNLTGDGLTIGSTIFPPVSLRADIEAAVNLQDAIAILKMIVGLDVNGSARPLSPYQSLAADFDGNGQVALTDAIGVLKHVVGLPASEPHWRLLADDDPSVPTWSVLAPRAEVSVRIPLQSGLAVKQGLVAVLVGDVDGSVFIPGAVKLEDQRIDYLADLVSRHSGQGLSLTQFGVYSDGG